MKMQAVTDLIQTGDNYPVRSVTVTGENGIVRVYTITGGSEASAVSEGMRRFQAEFDDDPV
jgi:hypothetical protein